MSGKGSGRRPQQVPDENVQDAWKRIFGRKPTNQECDRYEQLEREHMGDPDKQTGIYAKEKADESKSSNKGTS